METSGFGLNILHVKSQLKSQPASMKDVSIKQVSLNNSLALFKKKKKNSDGVKRGLKMNER